MDIFVMLWVVVAVLVLLVVPFLSIYWFVRQINKRNEGNKISMLVFAGVIAIPVAGAFMDVVFFGPAFYALVYGMFTAPLVPFLILKYWYGYKKVNGSILLNNFFVIGFLAWSASISGILYSIFLYPQLYPHLDTLGELVSFFELYVSVIVISIIYFLFTLIVHFAARRKEKMIGEVASS